MRLLDASDNVITTTVLLALPQLEAIKIENRLLDGSYHYQTIGEPGTIVEVEVIVGETGRSTVDDAEAEAAPLTVERDTTYYTGILRSPVSWRLVRPGAEADRLYRGTFVMAVTEEGGL